ncbi:MAG: Stk1 family PASTA domain-containing Ser/Thr kinase [Actinobacteria bacterium]|nr:Stk1 family PASTA domain-containing Ser/Thr kinase [Actinomycetota bacterium]
MERIAAGGMGEVFRAQDSVLAREVAIKVLHRSLAGDQGFVDRFRREARAAATLNHPNIVAVYDWGSVDGIYYMVMEYVRGRSVRDLLNAMVRLEPAQAAEVIRQALLALEHAHDVGIVHRDLKPENMLVNAGGVMKLTDLGLARAYADGHATQTGAVTGTVQYLAPEQIRGEPADPRTDLYSLGVVAFELLTGRLPFTGETAMAIAYKHLSDRVPRPSGIVPQVPEELDGFVASATERDRELRPESATEMRRDLESIARDLPAAPSLTDLVASAPDIVDVRAEAAEASAQTTTVTIPRVQRHRRRGVRRFFGALLAIAAVAAAAWGAWAYLLPHRVQVPNVTGLSVHAATAQLSDSGLKVRLASGVYSLTVDRGHVVKQDPQSGAKLERGAIVTLVPSLGPRPIPVPDLGGATVAEATKALEDAGFKVGDPKRRYSDTIRKGRVISTIPGPGQNAPEQSAISLVVSRGRPPVAVPDVVGQDVGKATAALKSLGFTVKVELKFSDTAPVDQVIAVDPKPKIDAAYGSQVTLTVSKGPQSFPCPDFRGMTLADARALAASLGLRVAALPVPGASGTTVVSQVPDPGATVRYGATITLYYA